jgi:hypothetical protein
MYALVLQVMIQIIDDVQRVSPVMSAMNVLATEPETKYGFQKLPMTEVRAP